MPSAQKKEKTEKMPRRSSKSHSKKKSAASKAKLSPQIGMIQKILDANIAAEDRTHFVAGDLAAMAKKFHDFAQERKPGKAKIEVFNPSPDRDGYISKHTVIMIANDDMPFLVDSTAQELGRLGISVHLIIHPIVSVIRDKKNMFTGFANKASDVNSYLRESWMYVEIDETLEPDMLKTIKKNLEQVLHQVRLAVGDWQGMRAKVLETLTELPRNEDAGLPRGEREEAAAFLAWIESDRFTFLGARDYVVEGKGKNLHLQADKTSGLGILRENVSVMFFSPEGDGNQPTDIHKFLERKQLVLVTKTHRRSSVHRASPMDAILVKRFNDKGELIGERLFVGLFTSSALASLPSSVPLIRNKIDYAVEKAKFDPRSHNGKALAHILNNYPREELFQISEEELFNSAMGIVHLHERQRLALFLRHDAFSRFVNCLLFVPRDQYSTHLRLRFEDILMTTFNGVSVEYNVSITDDPLAQIFIVVRTANGQIPSYNKEKLESQLRDACRGWHGHLRDELIAAFGENRGLQLAQRYANAFPDAYRDNVSPGDALVDIAFIEEVSQNGKMALHAYQPSGGKNSQVNVKWFNPNTELSLSTIQPFMWDTGLSIDAQYGPYKISPKGSAPVWVHDCWAQMRGATPSIEISKIRDIYEECLYRVWDGQAESDSYGALVLTAGLNWREVVIMRSVGKYLRQAGISASDVVIRSTLAAHPKAVRLLVDLFLARHNPKADKGREKTCAAIEKKMQDYLADVSQAEQDRVLRRYLNVIQNTLRTNYFQTDAAGNPKPYLAFKLDSQKLDDLPLPRPFVEIFVYSPKVEGIHLRGGKVARGGLRWSDRKDDFRTEVLGLLKAQTVKNTVIVPVGSKGGFVVKTPNPPNMAQEGVACYQTYINALLDITDNRKGEKIVPPTNVVRHDGNDPYLVVAADKGTAKFSDIANAISVERGFWLGDAFASGGSAGYDHKGMGITARGAWEAVKRHFRETGKDIQKEDFSVVGVGDMSGDVFGNGMLLSEHICLVGAFNHKHIFIDPTPDVAKSFKERKRMFNLPTSQWSDYDKKLISKGGGIYPRDAKTLTISKEAAALFNLPNTTVTPDDLLRAMLKAKVDLLWFGGIGTYVKSEEESHADAGDRANDSIRVNADEVRAQVVGEGANLGLTQRGRIAFAMKGGRINTDAIDNSAGVDTSDHEVNIKILLDAVMHNTKMSIKERNALLARMTDDVAKLVLRDNYLQTEAITIAQSRAAELLPQHARLMLNLERTGLLNRKVEFLPDEEEIQNRLRSGQGLTRPELAVLMGYAKIALYDDLLASSLPDNPALEGDLFMYFPKALQEKYGDEIRSHRLRREIIATFTTNSVINRAGLHFISSMKEKTGRSAADIATSYSLVRDVYGLRHLWRSTEALDGKIPASVQTDMFVRLSNMVERSCSWYLSHTDMKNTSAITSKHKDAVERIRAWIEKREEVMFTGRGKADKAAEYRAAGVPDALVKGILFLPLLALVPEIVTIADATGQKLEQVAELYFAVEDRFSLNRLRRIALSMPTENHWQREANALLIEDFYGLQSRLALSIIGAQGKGTAKGKGKGKTAVHKNAGDAISAWLEARGVSIGEFDKLMIDITNTAHVNAAQLNLALRQMQPWVQNA